MQDEDANVRELLTSTFEMIQNERMDGIPILNDALSVSVCGFERFGNFHMGVLLTPWFMNLLLVPSAEHKDCLKAFKVGEKNDYDLPGGQFEFILGFEESIGQYWACSLFSPVFEFGDQETAQATAQAVYEQVCIEAEMETLSQDDTDMQNVWEGELPEPEPVATAPEDTPPTDKPPISDMSRRDMFRGRLREQSSDVEIKTDAIIGETS